MKTRSIPAIIMLLAGMIRCVSAIAIGEDFSTSFVFSLLMVLIVFYIIGVVVKIILDKNIPPMSEQEEAEEGETTQDEEELENIQEEPLSEEQEGSNEDVQ